MAELIKCPFCQDASGCDHDQDARRILCREMGVAEEIEVPVYDTGDQRQVAEKARKSKGADRQADDDLRWVMGQPAGRRFVNALVRSTGIFRTSAAPLNGNGILLAFQDGERNFGRATWARLERVVPAEMMLMLKEGVENAA